jgi:hypothetical protein
MPPSRDPASSIAGLRRGAAVTLLAALLAVAFTWPIAPRLGTSGRLDTLDGHWSIWCAAWVAHALATDPGRLYDANIFHPHEDTLAYSENNVVAGVLGLPAYLATGNPYATHNLAVLFAYGLAFAGGFALARHLTRDTGAAIVAGIAFAFCPFMFARLAHIQLMMFFGLPIVLVAIHRLVDAPSVRRGLALGLSLTVVALACGYYGIFGALLAGLGLVYFGVTRGHWRRGDYWIAATVAAVVSIGLVVPFFVPYLRVQAELGFARSVEEAASYSADLRSWLASSAWAHRWYLPALGRWNEVLFPGLLTTAGGVWGGWQAWRAAGRPAASGPAAGGQAGTAAAGEPPATPAGGPPPGLRRDVVVFYGLFGLLAFWISFGPAAGLYRLLFHAIPVFSFLRAPSRIGILVVLALAMLLAIGLSSRLAGRPGRTRAWIAGAAAVAMGAELFTAPLLLREAPPPTQVHRYLATARRGPVLALPFYYERADFPRHARYMSESGWHWQPLVNGYSDHIPPEFRQLARVLHGFPSRESFAELRQRRARYVMIHQWLYSRRDRELLLERLAAYTPYLTLLAADGELRLYEISAWPEAHP